MVRSIAAGLLSLGVLAGSLATGSTAAQAQIVIQTPPIPGVAVVPPRAPGYGPGYWREGGDWRRRAEFREEEHRRWDWRRAHCVRGYDGQEYCRR